MSNRYSYLSYIFSECEFTNCVCNSLIIGIDNTNSERHNEVSQISDQNSSFSEPVYMVASKQQDTFYTNDNLINVSMRPSSADLDNTTLSTSNTCVNNVSISGTDTSAGIQSPAEHEGSYTDRSLSTGSDQNSSLFTTQVSDNSCSTDSDLSDGSASYQSNFQYILDLGLKCKGF